MSESSFDLLVIGAGPGGYVCAIRAAQLGLKTALVEKSAHLGGTCLNIGCIPSKALLHSSHLYHSARHGSHHGIVSHSIGLDLGAMMGRKDKVVEQLRKGVETLVAKRDITVLRGTAELLGEQRVRVSEGAEEQVVRADDIVLATGSVPVELPFLPFNGTTVVSSTEAIAFDKVPESLLVVGAGAIGLELGSVWARLGSDVTVVEFLPSIAGGIDADLSKFAERMFKKQGLKIETGTRLTGANDRRNYIELSADRNGETVQYVADKVLVAVGRRAYTEGLGLEAVGISLDERGRIPVDDHLRTSAEGIWAIGDVVAGPMLAHKAEEDGVAVAEWIAGRAGHVDWNLMPGVIYTEPEIATVGLSEKAAAETGRKVKVGKFPLLANGRAIAQDATDGLVKLIADAETDRLLGAAIIAAGASEMIASVVAHMVYGGSAEDLARTVHAHPTISESIKEAALAVDGRAIHAL
jgi:dihydrolipoamide dehydrogenase